jgi:very-short-patch-repair endonuclease
MRHPHRDRARDLRRAQTPAEVRLWSRLRGRKLLGAKFRRQVPVGRYIADFLCKDARLIIEADGGQHADAVAYDAARTAWLEAAGYQVLRFWNMDILNDTDAVMETIAEAVHWATHADNPEREER